MSFQTVSQAKARLNRCELAVPGSSPKFFEKAAKSEADIIFLDLEDAVAPDQKAQARANIVQALHDVDWGSKSMAVRINGLDTHYMYRDVVDVVEQAGDKLDLIMIPKAGTAADIYAVDMLLTQIETAKGFTKRIGLEAIIETALGMQNIEQIAAASPRLESLHFGVADYAASTRARTVNIGGPNPDYGVLSDPDGDGNRQFYWGDMWHYAINRMVIAARANGLRPIDGPFGDFSDPEGYKAQARRAAILGCEGKWAIHPSQIALANEVFAPSADEVAKARAILKAMEDAQAAGQGAVALDGKLIDNASIKQARVIVDQAEAIGM
ncbi:HpcH/HpaI aldolase/citrate lyase family protein [Marinibaculum pumilum]|uniref:HpcH/HpaI aldolase/citrate lyase family protein n=1 Tax=Marinibaculum pumilum TaxID=1766165 RepID=A0ABV7KXW9_9PROT